MAGVIERARDASRVHLRDLPRRWAHVQAVAGKTEAIAGDLLLGQAAEVVAAGWLHDVGYASDLAATGFHPVDGAAFAQHAGFPTLVVSLIAYHTGAELEAEERGLTDVLKVFERTPRDVLDVVTFADMTTSPDGEPVNADVRLAEILARYANDDPVARAVRRSAPELLAAVARVGARLDSVGVRVGVYPR